MEKIKDINFVDYQFDSLGGQWIYTPYMDYYKRNKRDVKKYIKFNGRYFELFEILPGYYNKAIIYKEIEKENYFLLSYETIVAEYKDEKMILYGYYSQTTAKHINTFLHINGYKSMSKKEIENNINKELEG